MFTTVAMNIQTFVTVWHISHIFLSNLNSKYQIRIITFYVLFNIFVFQFSSKEVFNFSQTNDNFQLFCFHDTFAVQRPFQSDTSMPKLQSLIPPLYGEGYQPVHVVQLSIFHFLCPKIVSVKFWLCPQKIIFN